MMVIKLMMIHAQIMYNETKCDGNEQKTCKNKIIYFT